MKKILLILSIIFFIINCASSPRYHSGNVRPQKKYVSKNKKSANKHVSLSLLTIQREKSAIFMSSYYGKKFNGRPTASGEIFDMYGDSAAHKELPLGTILNVTYLKTGKSVVVKVNDRGPFIQGRDLDLSFGAAKKIGLVKDGVGKVKIRVIHWGEGRK